MDAFSNILFYAHSGLRYLVLLAGLLAFGYTLVSALRDRAWDRPARILIASFVGLLDLQVLLGLVLVFLRAFYAALWGHLVMMILAAAVAHITSAVNRRRSPERQSQMTAALGVAGALILIVGGIMAIGQSVL